MLSLFTIVLEYAGGTYISQVDAQDYVDALTAWERQLADGDLKTWRLERTELQQALEEKHAALEGLRNAWCTSTTGTHGLVLINVIKTDPDP